MEKEELISYLSKKYSIDEGKLQKIVKVEKEIIGLEGLNHIHIKRPDGSWETRPKGSWDKTHFGLGKHEEYSAFRKAHRWVAEYHTAIYGGDVVKVSFEDEEKEYSLDEFKEKFSQIILFIFPLYGAFEYNGENLKIQNALKKFAIDFGRYVRKEVMVFDYWTEDEFNYEQYRRQKEEVMIFFNISNNACPGILVSNISPFSWNKPNKDKKAVLLIFKNFNSSEIGSKLRKLADKLEDLKFPSSWGNKWDRFIKWCKSNDIVGKGLGAASLIT